MQFHFHFAPAIGWMNDPNGLIDVDGTHHLFFQHNPFSAEEGPASGLIRWGHATSADFVHWTELPTALVPGDVGGYDDEGCYSGCAVRLDDGRIAVLYSGHTSAGELPCLAFADDDGLVTWTKSPANPVIASWPPLRGVSDFRDHSVGRRDEGWAQWIAVGSEEGGMVVEYTSPDFENWDYAGVLLSAREAGLPDGVWECPDVFEIDGTTVVIVSWYTDTERETIWVTGTRAESGFTTERWGRLDPSGLLYAPQSYTAEDGRRILFGWLQTHTDPAARGQENRGAQTVPRVLGVREGVLVQEPAAEIDALRGEVLASRAVDDLASIPVGGLDAFEISLSGRDLAHDVELEFVSTSGQTLAVPLALFGEASHFVREDASWAPRGRGVDGVRVLFDRGLVEMFADDGRASDISDLSAEAIAHVTVRKTGSDGDPVRIELVALR